MRIGFFGDSLTEGFPGVSSIGLLKQKLPEYTLLNYGRGGDTVISLLRRIQSLPFPIPFDIAFLWVGVNDVLVKTSWIYPAVKFLRRQPWAKSHPAFKVHYRNLLLFLLPKTKRLFTVPPLLISEDLNNPWNRELAELGRTIEEISGEYPSCCHIDLRKLFISKLKPESVSRHVPKSLFRIFWDAFALKTPEAIEEEARARGLHLTLDGVHLNAKGAALAAEALSQAIEKELRE